ncbi:MAG TPA: S-layer homology domain-containing protein [Thermoanaerobaculia bacterium]|nr:S-layer homology domain-containing protein [Thermoanaerobaculia bacterium]
MKSLTRAAKIFSAAAALTLAAARAGGQPMAPRLEAGLPGPTLTLPTNWWNTDVSAAPVDGGSAAFIAYIDNGSPRPLHPDFGGTQDDGISIYGFPYVVVDASQPKKTVQFDQADESDGVDHSTETSYPFYPIPDAAITQPHWIEGGDPGNIDDTGSIDRHLLIVDRDNRYLYELYNVWWDGSQWTAYSGAFFDLKTNDRRPDGWTSADAGGLAILPGLVRYDEVFGPDEIRHAFRFTVRHTHGYSYPGSHLAGPQIDGAPPMGMRMRLKASKDISGFSPEIQKIFRAMKRYGLIVADNGSDMYISGTWDVRWDNDVLNPAFGALTADDFEVIQLGWQPPLAPALAVDARTGGTSNQNGVLEPGETAVVEPSWENPPSGSATLAGTASAYGGPAGAAYTMADASAAYGAPAYGAPASCFDATANCYALTLSNPAARPAPHWDAVFTETVGGTAARTWTLHVGASFSDVPVTDPYYAKIETLFHNGVTAGCNGGEYCPGDPVTRAQMAVFLLKGKLWAGYVPPPGTGTRFSDVPPGAFALDWIEDLADSGITAGCDVNRYCPDHPVTRAQMAVFLLKAEHGSAYAPPAAMGVFADVPASDNFAPWIEELAAEGITAGCGGGNYCPDSPNTRAQMAAFLDATFGLSLYGP